MSDVLVKPAFQSAAQDSGDTTKFGPNAWNAARLFSGGVDGQIVTKSAASATGAAWVDSIPTSRTVNGHALSADVIVTQGDLGLGNVENTALSTWGGSATITTVGTIGAGTWQGSAVAAAFGGTGLASYAVGDLIYASGATTLSKLAVGAAGTVVVGGSTPSYSASPTLAIGASGSSRFLQATLSDHGAVGHYNFTVGYAANAGDASRGDHVLTIGYNTANGGGRADVSEPAFEWRIEDYYAPTANPKYVEAHWQYYDATGAGYRPIALLIDRSNGGYLTNAPLDLKSNSLSYTAMNGTQYAQFQQGALNLLNGANLTTSGGCIFGNTSIGNAAGGYFYWSGRCGITSPADGVIRMANTADTGFTRLDFGGTTASFPALARNGVVLETKLANDSAYTTHAALTFQTMTAIVAAGGGAAPTFTTIGGTGPATAAQNGWIKMLDSTGAACWVPVWK